ncbi:hypothetical protein GCM10022215_42390 [Nocardioides fonticola]|uniref:EcsC family protein n=1 Tax=Nocardioides fonticola TaxID=450363 RepID=A0ABP7Y216_9ACTN
MSTSAMSSYERSAWTASIERLNRHRESPIRQLASKATSPVREVLGGAWNKVPAHAGIEEQIGRAMAGMKTVTFDPALRSVNAQRSLRRLGVEDSDDLKALDLRTLDKSLPAVRTLYSGLALAEGAGSALAVTGAEVATTVSAGVTVGVAAGAIAADAVASMALMGRVIGHVAAGYGYDVRLPEEEAFALGIISLGTASTAAEKTAALTSLRRLTTQMMRQVTWNELNRNALVKVIDRIFLSLGEKLTKRKLAQAVPVAGVLINAGLSAHLVDTTYRAARDVYRLRFLSEKYGLDPREWVTDDASGGDDVLAEAMPELEIVDGGDSDG